ncbi:MAG: hypothetical protein N3D11_07870 [Candidatus Sumerlaeia bacterium]|nr:hypothetical protein [Candidatus Sumerlaeia bacterium]
MLPVRSHSRLFPLRTILLPAAITLFWLIMMMLLLRNQVFHQRRGQPIDVTPALLTEQWQDFTEWMKLTIGGQSEGICFTSIRRRNEAGGYLAANRIWIRLGLWGGQYDFRIENTALLDSLFRLQSAQSSVHLAGETMRFAALSDGTRLFYRWQYGDQTRVGLQHLDRPISLLEAVRPLAAQRLDLRVGTVYRLPVLDSTWSLREGVAEIRVEALETLRLDGKAFRAYRLAIQLGPFTSKTWVSPDGEVLRREFAQNIVMERVHPDEARKMFPGIDAPVIAPALTREDFRREGKADSLDGESVGPLNLLLESLLKSSSPRSKE